MEIDEQEYGIYRLMEDASYQQRGLGKTAMKQLISKIEADKDHHLIRISFEPTNVNARTLYESLGFVTTDKFSGDEIISEITC
jgi:diamine N-acetyltransferase